MQPSLSTFKFPIRILYGVFVWTSGSWLSIDASQQEIFLHSGEYLSIYFSFPGQILDPQTEDEIPATAKRNHPTRGNHQLLTSHLLKKQLAPQLPADAFALIAFAVSNLWPRDGWNPVIG